ncbi:probable carboxylesterase 8 [Tanacetum coccineum]
MASQTQPTNLDPYKLLNITLNSDGSLTRPTTLIPVTLLNPQLTTDSQLSLFKDIPLNITTGTFLRLYRPVSPPAQKIPIIIYFHGGGFILVSATTSFIHLTCSDISAHSPAIIVSLEYRLAPEHRLPAAYDDGLDALRWVRDQALRLKIDGCDEWLSEFADFSKVYLMGTSAGGNLTYNAGLRALDVDLDPVEIRGLIMDQPFFGGVERTEAELRLVNDHVLPLAAADLMWSLALPVGSDRDHEYCNPLLDRDRSSIEYIKRLPTCLVRVNSEDPLVDRQKDFANMLEARGVHVIRKFYEEGCHGAEIFDAKKAKIFYDDVKNFIWLD